MFDYFRILYRRIYNTLYLFFDKLSMRTRPKNSERDIFTDEEIENILSENKMFG
jgi:hypothetical protein